MMIHGLANPKLMHIIYH